jgi:small basic protein
MSPYPHEISLRGIFIEPYFAACVLGVLLAWVAASLMNRLRLTRFFVYPPLIFVAMAVIFTGLIGTLVMGL